MGPSRAESMLTDMPLEKDRWFTGIGEQGGRQLVVKVV